MTYDSQVHHRQSYRLKGYDYSLEGLYFVTVCVQDKRCLFGNIEEGEMKMNDVGKMVEAELLNTMHIRDNMIIHEYIIMPNHLHFILQITHSRGGLNPPANTKEESLNHSTKDSCYPGGCNPPLRCSNTIGAMVRGFKGAITRKIGYSIFQRNYYEHIIRNQRSYEEIADYIVTNPLRWEKDKLYSG